MSIAAFLPVVGKVIDRIFPDATAAQEAKLKIFELEQQGALAELDADVQVVKGQLAVNEAEARSSHWFVAAWRPSVGWVCSLALAWNFVVYPTVTWFGVEAPPLGMDQLMVVLLGMLGIGGMRSFDKSKRVDTQGLN